MTGKIRTTRWQIFHSGLKDFTDNLEPTEVRAPAHISQESDSEPPTKVAPRKHRI